MGSAVGINDGVEVGTAVGNGVGATDGDSVGVAVEKNRYCDGW